MMRQGMGDRQRPPRAGRKGCAIALTCALLVAIATPLAAKEVYRWTDENGVTHYSDTPRAGGQVQLIDAPEAYHPGSVDPEPPKADDGTAGDASPTAAEGRRAQLRENAQARREREEQLEQLCGLHRQRLEQMEPARRVLYIDKSGETVRMDDDQRMELIAESRDFLDANCSD